MSTSSMQSDITVSAFGQEMSVGDALDKVFEGLQTFLNECHTSTRTLAMVGEQDADFQACCRHADEIEDAVNEMGDLFKELKSCVKQLRGKPEGEGEKQWYRKHSAQRKLDLIQKKEDAKKEPEAEELPVVTEI